MAYVASAYGSASALTCALAVAAALGRRTLVVVNRGVLALQWRHDVVGKVWTWADNHEDVDAPAADALPFLEHAPCATCPAYLVRDTRGGSRPPSQRTASSQRSGSAPRRPVRAPRRLPTVRRGAATGTTTSRGTATGGRPQRSTKCGRVDAPFKSCTRASLAQRVHDSAREGELRHCRQPHVRRLVRLVPRLHAPHARRRPPRHLRRSILTKVATIGCSASILSNPTAMGQPLKVLPSSAWTSLC